MIILIKIVISAIVGPLLLFTGLKELRLADESPNWPAVTGHITKSEIVPGKRIYTLDIEYQYSLGNDSFTGETIAFGMSPYADSDRAVVEKDQQKYLTDTKVTVYRHPTKPHISVLEPGPTDSKWFAPIAGLVITLFGWVPICLLPFSGD